MSNANVAADAAAVKTYADIQHAGGRLKAAIPELEYPRRVKEILKGRKLKEIPTAEYPAVLAAFRLVLATHLATIGPIHPLIPETKRPATLNGVKDATQDMSVIRVWCQQFPNCNWGITANVMDVDTAVKPGNTKSGAETWSTIAIENGEPDTYHVRTASGGDHFYIVEELPNGANTLGEGIDSRGVGKGYVVAAGSHVTKSEQERVAVTGFYVAINDKPISSVAWVTTLKGYKGASPDRGNVDDDAEPQITNEQLAECLGALDVTQFRDQSKWERLAMSCHSATAGQGLDVFEEWSLSDTGYNGRTDDIKKRWDSFKVHKGGDIAIHSEGGLFDSLRAAGREDLELKIDGFADAPDVIDPIEHPSVTPEVKARWQEWADKVRAEKRRKKAKDERPRQDDRPLPEPLSLEQLLRGEWPEIEYTVAGLIMKGVVNTLNADGGTGKTTVATQFGTAIWFGRDIFGRKTQQCPVLLVLGEDGEWITQKRIEAQLNSMGVITRKDGVTVEAVNPDLPPFVTWCLLGYDMTLAKITDDGRISTLAFYDRLDAQLTKMGAGAFVVLDSLIDVVQMNMIEPMAVNAFFKRLLTGLCQKHACTILVLAHPSKASMADGSWVHGSLAMKNAVRNSIAMRKVDGQPYRILWSLKHNYGGEDETRLYFEKPLFTITKPTESTNADVRRGAAILEVILDQIGKNETVCHSNQGSGYTPRAIADMLNESGAFKPAVHWREVQTTMLAARRSGVLRYVVGYGKTPAHYERIEPADDPGPDSDFAE